MKDISAQEKKWRAEDDARIMASYEEIMSDNSRKKAAISAAKSMASDLNKRASAMNKVATSKSSSKTKSNTRK